ncbi:MAG: hypothetical protein ACL7BU_03970 [Candidatus Phlomobacter fragariae]
MNPFASISSDVVDGELIILGDMESKSSGSPLVSRETHNILGILWGRFLFIQQGISSLFLIDKLKRHKPCAVILKYSLSTLFFIYSNVSPT